jgi:hypothetical protein
MLMLAMLT